MFFNVRSLSTGQSTSVNENGLTRVFGDKIQMDFIKNDDILEARVFSDEDTLIITKE